MNSAEHRRSPRYPFIATAELIEQTSDVRIATRVSELSRNGCYLDMMTPFPIDTAVMVKIFAGGSFFQSKGTVIYSHPNLGAGIAFLETEAQYLPVLEGWLAELEKQNKEQS
jgi:hypothetical protein